MSLTYNEAKDEIFSLFKAAWDMTGHPVHWQEVKKSRSKSEDAFAMISIRHAAGFQSTLGSSVGTTRFSRIGFTTIQIFVAAGKGLQEAYVLAKVASDAFEGVSTPGGVWFRNLRLNEVGKNGQFFQLNVVAEFNYDEIK